MSNAHGCRKLLAMTTRRLTLIAAAALAAAAAILLPPGEAQANRSTDTVLKLSVTGTKLSTVDVPPLITSKRSPESPGDEIIAVSKIGGSATGHRFLMCAATQSAPSIEKALYACQVTYTLAAGTITASGVVHLNDTAAAAITGGTGAYAGARGVLTSTPGKDTLTLQ
jgi:hypothetical protein